MVIYTAFMIMENVFSDIFSKDVPILMIFGSNLPQFSLNTKTFI